MKVFICASKYNYKYIPEIKEKLEELGHIITLPNSFEDPFFEIRTKEESKEKHIEVKAMFLKEQAQKVRKNDAVLVVNLEKSGQKNYIGGATFLEMFKAFELNKKIFLYNPIPEGILENEIIGMNPIILNGDLKLINL
jgi:hypothetical protein